MTFDVPYDRAVTELRALYPPLDASGRRGKEPEGRQPRKTPSRQSENWRSLEHLAGHDCPGVLYVRITHEEPSPASRSVLHIEAAGRKLIWKRQVDITIRRLSEARTAVTVHCEYLRYGLFGYRRRRDLSYERERLAEIRARLERQ